MTLKVQIKNAEFGKGWYGCPNIQDPTLTDENIQARIRAEWPDATAVRITREYPCEVNP